MPVCRKCGTRFPTYIKIDGVKHITSNRRYCISCSPFNKHNTKKLEPSGLPAESLNCVCQFCGKVFRYDRKAGHQKTTCNSCVVRRHHRKVKEKAIAYKGGSCQLCGYHKCPDALDFHHPDPEHKEFGIGASYNRKWESLVVELDKCILVCNRCHKEIHAGVTVLSSE